ncbi:MAG TPA: hypothetical protein VFV08_15465 [Puia sp.]|nr:hypothetical protein [Puia sp.]
MNKTEAIEFFKEAIAHTDPEERKKSYEAQTPKHRIELKYEERTMHVYDSPQTLLQVFMRGRLDVSYHISREEATELKKLYFQS